MKFMAGFEALGWDVAEEGATREVGVVRKLDC